MKFLSLKSQLVSRLSGEAKNGLVDNIQNAVVDRLAGYVTGQKPEDEAGWLDQNKSPLIDLIAFGRYTMRTQKLGWVA